MKVSLPVEQLESSESVKFTYDSQKRKRPSIEQISGVIQYRDLVLQLVRRDIVARYKRSVLGIAWTMLQPLGMMLVLTIVFSQLFHHVEGYAVYLLSGLIAWNFFAQTTTSAIYQSVWGGALIRRIYVPQTVFSVSTIGTGIVNLTLSLVPMFLIMVVTHRPITPAILFLPYSILLLTAFSLGFGLLLSTLAVKFADIAEIYRILLQAWLYLTPIMYPADILPEFARKLLFLNPMYYMILLFRVPIYDGVIPAPALIAAGTAIAVLTLVVGWIYYSHRADNMAYSV
jgi:ABC-type polysaccharide/polyol phosphate export permease